MRKDFEDFETGEKQNIIEYRVRNNFWNVFFFLFIAVESFFVFITKGFDIGVTIVIAIFAFYGAINFEAKVAEEYKKLHKQNAKK